LKKSGLVKVGVGIAALAAFGLLFMRSLDDARTTAYTVERQHLSGWTASLEATASPGDPIVSLRPSPVLAAGLFRQIFSRAMESLNTPAAPAIPLVLKSEFDRQLADTFTPETLLAAARAAGLESSEIVPRCLVHRRVSEPGGTRQVYLVFFDAPAVSQFRSQLGLETGGFSPVMFVAGAGTDFNSWLPQRVNVESDCLAPIEIEGS
jgi:hypothetical protein